MTAEAWALTEVRAILERAGVGDEAVGVDEIRAEAGVGHDDLTDVLSTLRERGEAVEDEPGKWRTPYGAPAPATDAPDVQDDVVEHAPEQGGEADRRVAEFMAPERQQTARAAALEPGLTRATADGSQIVLTATILGAMTAEVIGAIVHAGVAEAAETKSVFVFRVEP